MAADVLAHVMNGGPLPVSLLDALEAGLLALEHGRGAHDTESVVDLAESGTASTRRLPARRLRA